MPEANLKDQTVLGFDFGLRRIGVAVGQTITGTAAPLNTVKAQDGVPDWQTLADLITLWRPHALIVGMPLHIDASEQAITHTANQFAQQLRNRFNLPVHRVDERYTTLAAKQLLYEQGGFRKLKKAQIDGWAAKLILESWLKQFL